MPVILCEGVFDAIAIKRNAVPILGKVLSQNLTNKILMEKPEVKIVLDKDALSDAIKAYTYLTNNGINCKLVTLQGKDPSEVGFVDVTKQIETNTTSSFEDLIKLKLTL
jgi:DNA primase